MQLLTISTLYPNCNDPKHGIFVKTRLRHLLNDFPEINARVIAPVPWFPLKHKVFGEYAKYANVPAKEVIDGLDVYHPKYLVIPKLGMYLTPLFMRWGISRTVRKLQKQAKIDLIDAHYFYPDGVAIAKVATALNIPFTCTARGTDINLVPQYPKALKMLRFVFKHANHMMTVCQALKDEMVNLGVEKDRITVLRNGVDLQLFKPSDDTLKQQLKAEKGISGPLILSVGWLIERKGHYLIIQALKDLPEVTLAIAGDGPDKTKLLQLAIDEAVSDRVLFLGALSQPDVNRWMQTADMLVLASSREGWANVLLEAMASGTPVVATKVWGTPEVVQTEDVGVLVERDVPSLTEGVKNILSKKRDRQLIRKYAESFDWQATSLGQKKIFEKILQS